MKPQPSICNAKTRSLLWPKHSSPSNFCPQPVTAADFAESVSGTCDPTQLPGLLQLAPVLGAAEVGSSASLPLSPSLSLSLSLTLYLSLFLFLC